MKLLLIATMAIFIFSASAQSSESDDCTRIAGRIAKAIGGEFSQPHNKFFVFSTFGFNLECPSNDKGEFEIEILRDAKATKGLVDLTITTARSLLTIPPSKTALAKAIYDCIDQSKLDGIIPYFKYEMIRFECFTNPAPHIFIKMLISDVDVGNDDGAHSASTPPQ